MDGEVRVWDVRKPDEPLYTLPRRNEGLMALAVHTGAPVLARYVMEGNKDNQADGDCRTTAITPYSTKQDLEITGFKNPLQPQRLAKISIPVPPAYNTPRHRAVDFLPSSASLVFHPVSCFVHFIFRAATTLSKRRRVVTILSRFLWINFPDLSCV